MIVLSTKNFIAKYSGSGYQHIGLYSEDWKQLYHIKSVYQKLLDHDEIPFDSGYYEKNCHIIQTTNHNNRIGHCPFTEQDPFDKGCSISFGVLDYGMMMQLLEMDKYSEEYYYKSTTLVSNGGYSMTLMKTDDFGKHFHDSFRKIAYEFEGDFKVWDGKYYHYFMNTLETLVNKYAEEKGIRRYEIDDDERWKLVLEASGCAIEKYGSFEDFLKEWVWKFDTIDCDLDFQRHDVEYFEMWDANEWVEDSFQLDWFEAYNRLKKEYGKLFCTDYVPRNREQLIRWDDGHEYDYKVLYHNLAEEIREEEEYY